MPDKLTQHEFVKTLTKQQMKDFKRLFISRTEVEEIEEKCSDVSMLIETTLGAMKPGTHYYKHLEIAQEMLGEIWMSFKTKKDIECICQPCTKDAKKVMEKGCPICKGR